MPVIEQARRMWGMGLFLSGCHLGSGEYLILASPDELSLALPNGKT